MKELRSDWAFRVAFGISVAGSTVFIIYVVATILG
ncbi:hypothetical protein LCGC14_0365720 [marine sediment metagenome]|uniref:Uncharacterized protein n=1 Tax=marine sediment metagenome TaxID=412755 RepID=A0A0F9T6T2_9ZZZZ